MSDSRTILFPSGIPKNRESLAAYRQRGGYEALRRALTQSSPFSVLQEVEAARLRGRGGAGFSAAQKLVLCAKAEGKQKYVVANGGEDEPGSRKDCMLLERVSHAVLEGILLAAYAVGATRAFFYINETYQQARTSIDQALAEAQADGLVGDEVLGTKFAVTVESRPAPTQYVAGEDTAALEVLEGREPYPRPKPPYPVTSGLFGQPTVVNNVETLANLAPIVLNGAQWYRGFGTEESPGTMLYSMNEEWQRPGVYELPYGAREAELLEECAGGLKDGARLRAILPGGPSSGFLLPDPDRPLSPEALKAAGSSIGCGVMRGYGEGTCMVEVVLEIARFFEKESCGQCPACRMETSALATLLGKAHQGQVPAAALDQIPRLLDFNKGKGDCSLVNMPGPPLLTALKLFPEDFHSHLNGGNCPAT